MIFCYVLAMLVIITMVIGLIVMNTFLLLQQTVDKVDSTRNTEANEDLLNLAKSGSQVVYSAIYEGILAETLIQYMLIDMFREETFAVAYTDLYEFGHLSIDYIMKNPERYGNNSISLQYPTILYTSGNLTENGTNLAQKVSRFSYVLPELFQIYKSSALRFTMAFQESGFTYFYPGLNLTEYDEANTVWYKEYAEGYNLTLTHSYPDTIGNASNQILSIVLPLYDSYSYDNRIGVLCGDWLVSGIYTDLENLIYLGKGYQYLVYKDGSIIDTVNHPWINSSVTNLANINYYELWENIQASPTGTQFLIEEGDIWRVATSAVLQNPTSNEEWNFILLLIVKESDVMSYKEDAKTLIKTQGTKFIVITVACSLLASIVVVYFIHRQAKHISGPIQGIIDFTYKLNSEGNNEEVMNELNNLQEGTDQTARLVLAYKELAKSLINRKKPENKNYEGMMRIYPPNEFYRIDKNLLMENLELIPLNNNLN